MPDMTVTWKGAVPFDGMMGQAEHHGAIAVGEVGAEGASTKFTIRPFLDTSYESAMSGAVPYVSDTDHGPDLEELFLSETAKKGRK